MNYPTRFNPHPCCHRHPACAGSHRDFGPQNSAALYDPVKNQAIALPDFALRRWAVRHGAYADSGCSCDAAVLMKHAMLAVEHNQKLIVRHPCLCAAAAPARPFTTTPRTWWRPLSRVSGRWPAGRLGGLCGLYAATAAATAGPSTAVACCCRVSLCCHLWRQCMASSF